MQTMGSGRDRFKWRDNWARTPDTKSSRENGRTHGVAVLKDGRVVVFHQANPGVLIFDQNGKLQTSWGDYMGAHGLSLVEEKGRELLWLTDQNTGSVTKTDLDGKFLQSIEKPAALYKDKRYSPTWVAVNPKNGDVWVADGYGSSMVHRYDKSGDYKSTLTGAEGKAGAFSCPHGIAFVTRRGEPELFITDRSNKRVQVYDAEGRFKRVIGEGVLTSPCAFATHGDRLYVPELRAKLAVFDDRDKLVTILGDNEKVCDIPGWPNHKPELIEPGKFNSPHGIAVNKRGDVFVVEWIVGGRITKLSKL